MKSSVSTEQITTAYNRVSSSYFRVASALSFGRIWAAQTSLIEHFHSSKNTLIIGGGSGELLKELLSNTSASKITCLDISPRMNELAQRDLTRHQLSQCSFIQGDFSEIPKNEKYDAVFLPFILDHFSEAEVKASLIQLTHSLTRDATIFFADIRVSRKSYWHKRISTLILITFYQFAKIWIPLKINTPPKYDPYFEAIGYRAKKKYYSLFRTITARVYRPMALREAASLAAGVASRE